MFKTFILKCILGVKLLDLNKKKIPISYKMFSHFMLKYINIINV